MRLSFEFSNILGSVYNRGTVKFGPDGSRVYSPVGNKVIVYNLKANKSNALPIQVNYNIEHICIHPKDTILLAASEKTHLYIISLVSGKLLHLKQYKTFSKITHISFSPDGRYYCVCGDSLVLVYVTPGSLIAGRGREISPFRLLRKYRVGHDSITSVTWSQTSEFLCVASHDTTLNILYLEERHSITKLRGHTDVILSCHFANRFNSDKQLYSVTKNCQLFVWDEKPLDDDEENANKRIKRELKLHRSAKHYLNIPEEPSEAKESKVRRLNSYATSTGYSSSANLLVVGYNTGHYSLYETPGATLVRNFYSDHGSIDTIAINHFGDWIAFGSSVDPEVDTERGTNRTESRLCVLEWQSKSNILDQVGSGATMANMHECASFSLDGTHVVSGNLSGRIKVWSALSGETVAEFGHEHNGPIKVIKFVPNKSGKVIISASLDGTLRAYDLGKFKNFRTFKSPVTEKSPEFISMDIDSTGEFIAAGTYNYFEIYLFSLQTGKFLDYLTGHEGPVSGLAFSPNSNLLVSTSWDNTVRIWNLFEGSKCIKDTIDMRSEVITVAFRPDGNQFAVSMSNGQIALFNPQTSDQLGAPIEGGDDLGTTQLMNEISRDSSKYFISLHYSADGSYLIAAGKSNFICIYHAQEKILLKKIALTFNMSMDGVFDYVSNRRRSEFGYNLELLEQRMEERASKPIQLPGVRKGDLGERQAKPVIAVYQIVFAPTMRSFACASTEGVLIYSLDIIRHFDPYKLVLEVDPSSVKKALSDGTYGLALVQSIQLNDVILFEEVIEKIPLADVETTVAGLELDYVMKVLDFIGRCLSKTRHLEYYLNWTKIILYKYGMALKSLPQSDTTPIIRTMHQNAFRHMINIKRNCDFSRYSLEYLTRIDDQIEDESENMDAEDDDVPCLMSEH